MSALKWLADRAGNPITILSTELDGVPNGGTVLSGPIENSVSQDLYADFALTVGFQSAPSFGYGIELYIVRSLDGVVFDQKIVVRAGAPNDDPILVWSSNKVAFDDHAPVYQAVYIETVL